jgi:hypothetical protein
VAARLAASAAAESDAEALVTLHHARTQAESIALKLRAWSHRWLLEHGYPSGLPDHLKPSAERIYPRVVEGVGISVNFRSPILQPITERGARRDGGCGLGSLRRQAHRAGIRAGAHARGARPRCASWSAVSEIRFDASAWSSADCAAETANQIEFWFANSPAHEGIVASRCRQRLTQESTNKYYNSRSAHIASEDLTAIKVAFESPAGTTLTASVEYPAGTMTQLTFGGNTSAAIGARSYFTDYATVSIPKGATFWIRQFENATSGGFIRYNTWQNSFLGEAMELSVTVLTDKTMSGTIANSGSPLGNSAPPLAIVGVTKARSVMVIGDSIGQGTADTEDSSSSVTGFNGVVGFINRSLDSLGIPFANVCQPGTIISSFPPSIYHATCTHLISEFSLNDFDGSESSATVIGALSNFGYYVAPATKFYQTTSTPHSLSSDGWVSLVNQSTNGTAIEAQRDAFNSALRAGTTGISRLTGFIDAASVLESGLNSNRWRVTPSPPYTVDGRHPSPSGHALVVGAAVVQAIFAIQSPKNKRNLVLRKRA